MSIEKKFDRAVEIVKDLPKEGPVQPTQDEQLTVSPRYEFPPREMTSPVVLQVLQAG